MKPKWTGEVVGKLHIYGFEVRELAAAFGCSPEYMSKLLSGIRQPKDAEHRVRIALESLIEQRKSKNQTTH